jgi:hypothetical protein
MAYRLSRHQTASQTWTVRNLAITLIHRSGSSQIAATRRHFASCPQEALALLSQKREGQQ